MRVRREVVYTMDIASFIGRVIWEGYVEGEALVTRQPISFYGGVDPETGRIIEKE
jgi:predicted aconitase with swiveling domain